LPLEAGLTYEPHLGRQFAFVELVDEHGPLRMVYRAMVKRRHGASAL